MFNFYPVTGNSITDPDYDHPSSPYYQYEGDIEIKPKKIIIKKQIDYDPKDSNTWPF